MDLEGRAPLTKASRPRVQGAPRVADRKQSQILSACFLTRRFSLGGIVALCGHFCASKTVFGDWLCPCTLADRDVPVNLKELIHVTGPATNSFSEKKFLCDLFGDPLQA